ncbi:MAG: hypothetical protein DRJ65_17685 [Acidobacteria bacterium]|nr:MAG: hypothetical protein DRJ65_17685 [Acidobacteriota bacterium]
MFGSRRGIVILGIVALVVQFVVPVVMAEGTAIEGAEVQCILNMPFPQISGTTQSGSDIDAARLFFKAADQSDFYWVPMTRDGDKIVGVLPQPQPETTNIVYYVETVDSSKTVSRSPEYTAAVVLREWDCQGQKIAGTFAGLEPNLIVGSTVGGATSAPLGFESTGIIGTVSPDGQIAAVGRDGELSAVDLGSLVGDQYALGGGIALLADRDVEEPASPSAP